MNLDAPHLSRIRHSFSVLLAHEAKKVLPPEEHSRFNRKQEHSIAILHRFLCSRVYPTRYTIIETNFFKKSVSRITDTKIIDKIGNFKSLLALGDRRLNDSTLSKEERFVSSNNTGFFDKTGRFVSDFLSDIIGVRHFHIGYNKPTNDTLLFVYFVQDTAFLLTVGSHKDIHVDSGNSIVFSALQDEFPSEVDNFFPELKGVLPEQPMASVPDRLDMAKTLKSAGVNSFFADQQGLVRLFGMGITSARTPVATTRFIHKVNNEIVLFFLKNSVGKWFDSPIRIVSLERIDAIPHLIVNQRDDFGRLCFTFMRLNEQHNTTRLIDMLDAVYFSQGVQRKSLAKKIRQNHHRGLS